MARPGLPAPSPGQTPNYRLLGRIASGGMGAVYLGVHTEDASFARLVAIKIIHRHLAENRVFVDMLADEAQVASKIHHPNVVGIIDVGEYRGRSFVVMPYIEGGTLSEFVRRQQRHLPLGLVVQVLTEALHGLHAAHSLVDAQGQPLGLVHRDVSPGNILLGIDGVTRVIDFGVAKAASRITHTAPGTVKGKFAYMAPEQAMGEDVDCRADVFSAGVVLWTVLTGKRLFNGKNSAHTIRNLMSAEIVPPSRLRPKVPAVLDRVCMRALNRVHEKRYQSAAAMAEDLQRAARAAGLEGSREDVVRMVSAAFAERIARRRGIVEESRRAPRAITVDQPEFELGVADLDDRGPVDGLTPPTPSARGLRSRGVVEPSTETDSGGVPIKQSETFSSMSEPSPGMRYLHTGLTPAEAHSVSGLVSGSQVPLDRDAALGARPGSRGHGKYVAIALVLTLAGVTAAMRDSVMALYTRYIGAPGIAAPAATQPATIEPVRIAIDDPAAAAPGTDAPAQAADGTAASSGDTAANAGDAAASSGDTAASSGDTAASSGDTAEVTDSASGIANVTAEDADEAAEATGGDADTAAAAPDARSDAGSDTRPARADDGEDSSSEGSGSSRRSKQRRERSRSKKPPLEIEKNPYLD